MSHNFLHNWNSPWVAEIITKAMKIFILNSLLNWEAISHFPFILAKKNLKQCHAADIHEFLIRLKFEELIFKILIALAHVLMTMILIMTFLLMEKKSIKQLRTCPRSFSLLLFWIINFKEKQKNWNSFWKKKTFKNLVICRVWSR